MKKTILFLVLIFAFNSASVFGQEQEETKGMRLAQKNFLALQKCEKDDVRKQYDIVKGLVLPEELGTTAEALEKLAFDCMETRYQPQELVANILSGKKRAYSIARLVLFIEQMGISPSNLTSLSEEDRREIARLQRKNREMLRRLNTYPTWRPAGNN